MNSPGADGEAVEPAQGRLHSRDFAGTAFDDIARADGIREADQRSGDNEAGLIVAPDQSCTGSATAAPCAREPEPAPGDGFVVEWQFGSGGRKR